jgi:hypothetical protein
MIPVGATSAGERGRASDGEKMGKGVRLSREELLAVKELLNKIEL